MRNAVLVVTRTDEPNVPRVVSLMRARGARVMRMDTDTFLQNSAITFRSSQKGDGCVIRTGGHELKLSEVQSVWYRRPSAPKARPDTDPLYKQFVENESGKFLWSLWSVFKIPPIRWVNHPLALKHLEFNKLYQLRVAARVGLSIPETLVTNNAGEALEFCEKLGGKIALKTFGGNNVKDSGGSDLVIYTTGITKQKLLAHSEGMKYAPVMFENYVPKKIELRITVVGHSIFACGIHSQDSPRTKDDWRKYDFPRVKHEIFTLPPDIERKIMEFMQALDISFGAIDMILTPDNEFIFLEVNPSGQWGWIEAMTGMPISEAIADLLVGSTKEDG